jgi:hypothetical protein
MESVSFKLPKDMVARLRELAAGDDVSVGQVIRLAVEREFRRRDEARIPPRVEERMLAPIRARVSDDFLAATSWSDLRKRLVEKGYSLRESVGGVALHDAVNGRFLCRTSEIGFGYPGLMTQLGGPMPGHSHTRILTEIAATALYAKG